MKILLVDDEIELVSTLAERLNMRGYQADWAGTYEDAVQRVETTKYDLAVLDIKLPRASGIHLKRTLEKIDRDLRFIFMTGHGSEDDYKTCCQEGDCYLVKPVSIEALIAKMKEILNAGGKA